MPELIQKLSADAVRLENGVAMSILKAEDFGGEYNQRSLAYISFLKMTGLWAMTTNSSQALWVKLFQKRDSSLNKILWNLGRDPEHISSSFMDRFSRYNRIAKVGAAGWRSLDLFYNYQEKIKPQLNGNFESWLTRLWVEKMENRQAVTNRLKVLIDLLSDSFSKFPQESEIRLVSVASGSAQAVIEAMKRNPHLTIRAILIDLDPTAIEEAGRMIRSCGLEDKFKIVCNTPKYLEEVCADFRPHMIEMVGFLDYRPQKQAVRLINRIKNLLPEKGLFLTCNINKNREKIFLDWVLLWPMIYRNEEEFSELLIEGGFSPDNIQLIYEPFRIHGIAVCRR
jgi:hypothetical protein